jgi:hypothetical protein
MSVFGNPQILAIRGSLDLKHWLGCRCAVYLCRLPPQDAKIPIQVMTVLTYATGLFWNGPPSLPLTSTWIPLNPLYLPGHAHDVPGLASLSDRQHFDALVFGVHRPSGPTPVISDYLWTGLAWRFFRGNIRSSLGIRTFELTYTTGVVGHTEPGPACHTDIATLVREC